jgi:redox-sensitive bicupin YhaK (pirin superfamily)
MQVPPHPHMGLQTVSWLLEGEVHHRDSIGSSQHVRAGELGLMTAGAGIAHAEYSPVPHPALLHGVQLWVALPAQARNVRPAWAHHPVLPVVADPRAGLSATVIMGQLAEAASPGQTHSELVGADIALEAGSDALLPLDPEFEHAVLVMSGEATIDGTSLAPGAMLYLGCARSFLRFRADRPARLLLLGGVPFEEQIVMWWNLIGRDHEEIVTARHEWMSGERFGAVADSGMPMTAPELPPFPLKPGGRLR